MFNKNDPLIGAVQEVMKRNHAEREVTRVVNEAFGIEDRKALPHEYQAEWDSVYQQVLSEGKITHPNQQVLNVHEPEKPELTSDDFRKLRAMKAKKKPVSEQMKDPNARDVTSPSDAGIKRPDYATGTPDYAKPKTQTVNRAEKTSLPAGTLAKTMKEEEQLDEKSPPGRADQVESLKKKFSDKSAFRIAWDSYKKSKKKKMNEGFNNRHDSSVTASVEEQVVAEQTPVVPVGGLARPGTPAFYARRAAETGSSMARGGLNRNSPGQPGARANAALNAKAPGMGGPNYNPNRALNAKAPGMGGPNYNPPVSTAGRDKPGVGIGQGPGAPAKTPAAPAVSQSPSFQFSDKQRAAAKSGKASAADVQAWAKSRGLDPNSKGLLRNYLNAAQNKTMKTGPGGVKATAIQTAAQAAEMKFRAAQTAAKPVVPKPNARPAQPTIRPSIDAAPQRATSQQSADIARNVYRANAGLPLPPRAGK